MKDIYLHRTHNYVDRTIGELHFGDAALRPLHTLEPPWHNNEPNTSCIPTGNYSCEIVFSHRFDRNLYEVCHVPERSNILIHAGNYPKDTEGCILVARNRVMRMEHGEETCILAGSKLGLDDLMTRANGKPFMLRVS